ncbi:hypothetical protein HT031_000485 [Scenedesmus sp. PABB004]|nr:hypothetical protein HT031_000485 [Scenedesmus sp. PABB004]
MSGPPGRRWLAWLLLAAAGAQQQAAGPGYPECPGIPDDWMPECWEATYARIQFGGDRTLYHTPFTSRRWGNALSPYWQARALAVVAGQGFNAFGGFSGASWLAYLPKKLPPTTCPQPDRFRQACDMCDDSWAYAHRCSGAWTGIRPTIIADTHAAMTAWAAASGARLPTFSDRDVVIQSRCSTDTVLSHPEYGPAAFSFYAAVPTDAASILVVADPRDALPLCAAIRAAKVAWLRARHPGARVAVVGGTLSQDWARLVLAPRLFKDAQSSLGLWAALANKGEVWSVPMLPEFTRNRTTPDLGPRWHWVHAPVLLPHVAEAAGIEREDTAAIVRWLEAH